MLISFIVSSQAREEKIFKTINTLKKQLNEDYELILVVDEINSDKEAIEFVKDQFADNHNLVIIFNSKGQGNALNWNNAMRIAKGDYVMFLKEGDLIEPQLTTHIHELVANQTVPLDIIEVQFEKTDLIKTATTPLLHANQLYNLTQDQQVFAYVAQELYGKCFRTKFIREHKISFTHGVRFDLLFLFQVLAHAEFYYLSDAILFKHKISPPKYSIFDMVNQWPHILNYYRHLNKYKQHFDALNFAYHYGLCYLYLNLVKLVKNDLTYKKSLNLISSKISRKLKHFTHTNGYLKETLTPEFYDRIMHFDVFIKNQMSKK